MMDSLSERISVLSDGTGDTAENYVLAILAQFQLKDAKVSRFPKIKNERELCNILKKFNAPHLVAYTFASEKLRKVAWQLIRDEGLTGIDLLYPALEVFTTFLKIHPTEKTGILHSTQAVGYFQRIEAIEFTVKHDDGMKLDELKMADIILTGVSRSSKTPTSIYLAHRGYKVANVPLVPGIGVPQELLDAEADGIPVIFLTINAVDLERIRKVRFQTLGAKASRADSYIDSNKIREELEAAQRLAKQHRWPTIDVTNKAIEETASEILLLVNSKTS